MSEALRRVAFHDPIGDVEMGWTLPATQVPIEHSPHAIEQANRRVFRHLNLELTQANITAAMPNSWVTLKPPTWLRHAKAEKERAHSWQINEVPRLAFALRRDEARDQASEYKLVAVTAFSDRDSDPVGATVRWT